MSPIPASASRSFVLSFIRFDNRRASNQRRVDPIRSGSLCPTNTSRNNLCDGHRPPLQLERMKAASPMEKAAREICSRLRERGHIAYFAGGCVRDIVRGQIPKDFDIATDATPDVVQKIFKRTYAVGAHFGVIVVLENEFSFEVATFRSDDAYIDGRRPSAVHFSSPEEDAKRRDL